MTGRERVLVAFRHQEPDRTPLFEKLIKLPTANWLLGRPHAAVDPEYRMERLAAGDWAGLMEQTARDIVEVAEICGFDMVCLPLNPPEDSPRPVKIGAHTWRVGNVIQEFRPGNPWVKTWPASGHGGGSPDEDREAALVRSLEAEWTPPPLDESRFAVLRHGKRILAERGLDLAVFTSCYTMGVATLPEYMFRWFRERPDLLHAFYERRSEEGIRLAVRAVELGADIIALGGDFASDLGPLISPPDYRHFIAVRLRNQAEALHSCGVFVTNASDGNLWSVLDDFLLTAGVDGYEEIDCAAGMDLAKLKARYGERITFIGNLDVRFLLTRGTPAEVQKAVFACLDQGRNHGGHILMSSNCIHEDIPPKNFWAYLSAYREYFGLE